MEKSMIIMTIMTIWNIVLAIGIIIKDRKIEKENQELQTKNQWQAKKIGEIIESKNKSIVEERTIETENIT